MKWLLLGASAALVFGATVFGASASGPEIISPAPASLVPAPQQHLPMTLHRLATHSSAESFNWSGYAVTGPSSSVTYVTGSWVIPAVTCPPAPRFFSLPPATYSSFWVGIDGFLSHSVEQIGTEADCTFGNPRYYAWFEFYPLPSFYATGLTNLAAGDIATASVTYNSNATFTLAITVQTSSLQPVGSFSTVIRPNFWTGTPDRSSAEWITEAPSNLFLQILRLSNFGTAQWGPDYTSGVGTNTATISNATQTLNWFSLNQPDNTFLTTMVGDPSSNYAPIAVPSALTSTSSFTVERQNPDVP